MAMVVLMPAIAVVAVVDVPSVVPVVEAIASSRSSYGGNRDQHCERQADST
jgi:hypothetical protein